MKSVLNFFRDKKGVEGKLYELVEHGANLRSEKSKLRLEMGSLRSAVEAAKRQLSHAKSLEAASNPGAAETVRDAEQILSSAEGSLSDSTNRIATIEIDLAENAKQRAAYRVELANPEGADAKTVTAHRKDLKTAKAECQRLRDLIAEQVGLTPVVSDESLKELERQRSRLLADAADGRGDDAAIKKNQVQLDAMRLTVAAEAERAESTIVGLQTKLEEAESVVADLEAATPLLAAARLATERDRILEELRDVAPHVLELHSRLQSIATAIRSIPGHSYDKPTVRVSIDGAPDLVEIERNRSENDLMDLRAELKGMASI